MSEIAFIGAGNMAASIIGGLLEQGLPSDRLRAADPSAAARQRLQNTTGVVTSAANSPIIASADVVILAVKPQLVATVCADVREAVAARQPLVVSIAAGITCTALERMLGESTALVRAMPNTPALLGAGATALFANAGVAPAQRERADQILGAVGTTCWLRTEAEMDAVTALSGSGPAYFFLFLEAMSEAGAKLGLNRELSRELAIQTGLGACRMAAEGDRELAPLRARVTSPGGTTESALRSFEADDLRGIVETAMRAARDRARELGREVAS